MSDDNKEGAGVPVGWHTCDETSECAACDDLRASAAFAMGYLSNTMAGALGEREWGLAEPKIRDVLRFIEQCATASKMEVAQCPNCKGTRAPSPLDPDWRGRCECAAATPPAVMPAAPSDAVPLTEAPEGWEFAPVPPGSGWKLVRVAPHLHDWQYNGKLGDYLCGCGAVKGALHAEPAAGEQAGAVAYALQWPGEARLNLSTVFDTEAEASEYLARCSPGVIVVPLFALAAPGAAIAAREQETRDSQTITLCGSARFERLFKAWNEALTMAGHTVFSLTAYPSDKAGVKQWYTEEQKAALDAAHFRKIAASDAIFVLNLHAYIGESTLREIEHARQLGKTVYFLESWGKGNGISRAHTDEAQHAAEAGGLTIPTASPIDTTTRSGSKDPWAGRLLGPAGALRSAIVDLTKNAALTQPTTVQQAGVGSQRQQIADLVLGEDLVVSSPLESTQGFGGDIEHRFQVSNGTERYGVVVIVTALKGMQPGERKEGVCNWPGCAVHHPCTKACQRDEGSAS